MLSKTIRMALIAMAVAAVSAATVNAQPLMLRASVPFAFTTADNRMPSGEYSLSVDPIFQRVLLQNMDAGSGLYLGPTAGKTPKNVSKPALVFHRYGDHYFLRAVYDPARSIAIEWPQSNAEKEMARNFTPVEVALALPAAR